MLFLNMEPNSVGSLKETFRGLDVVSLVADRIRTEIYQKRRKKLGICAHMNFRHLG